MPKLSVAELAKTLVHFHYHGVISTLATDGGYPYGSVIDYLPLSQGDVVVLLHERAEHYRYLTASPKASLLVNAHLAEHEALLIPRVTLLGEAQPAEDHSDMVRDYLARHPDAEPYVNLDGMRFFQIDVKGVRYIAGSGRAVWVDGTDYRAAKADPLGEDAPWIMHEMNDRYSDQLTAIARASDTCRWADAGRVVSVDRFGFDLICTAGDRRHALRVSLPKPAYDRAEFEQALSSLTDSSS
ncbi:MAG: HugZ family protein [Lysobacterales bacterium]